MNEMNRLLNCCEEKGIEVKIKNYPDGSTGVELVEDVKVAA
jgi:hypothetical protein